MSLKTGNNWKSHVLHSTIKSLDFIFLIDLLNFSFYSDSVVLFTVDYKGDSYTGYWALVALIHRALDDGFHITNPEFMKNASPSILKHIFRSDSTTEISLLESRIAIINHAGTVLTEKFNSSITTLIT